MIGIPFSFAHPVNLSALFTIVQSLDPLSCHVWGAWEKFEAGDWAGYYHTIAEALQAHADCGDVIVLAQASMAPAASLCPQMAIPILSSPRLGVEQALALWNLL